MSEIVRATEEQLKQGVKLDDGKDRWDLLPVDSTRAVVKVLTYGARKYAPYNWSKGMYYSRCYAAAQRHLTAFWEGQDNDEETGLCHLAHALCCLMFLLGFHLRGMTKFDDRPHTWNREE